MVNGLSSLVKHETIKDQKTRLLLSLLKSLFKPFVNLDEQHVKFLCLDWLLL